ncbi:redoxin domain-containing protein [Hymenobacter metallilatus]|nr:redoxin domain-containing protein [Hymenobacter metallilatus]
MAARYSRLFCMWWLVLAGLLPGGFTRAAPPKAATTATVYVFLSDTCPICQAATLTLRQLHATYAARGVQFVGVFPGTHVRPADIVLFQQQYALPFPLRPDEGQLLTRRFQARTTPEVVVAGPEGQVLYQGRIDDGYAALGQRRTVVQHQELRDALAALTAGRRVAVARTEAVGCLINR